MLLRCLVKYTVRNVPPIAQVVPIFQLDCKKISPLSDMAMRDGNGVEVPHIYVYWFAWQAFHPDTAIYRGKE